MDIQEYLKRIKVEPGVVRPDDRTLWLLQESHMQAVPFENLDILDKRPIAITSAAAYRKIVERKRGGYCYELNGLLAWLLRHLGFAVSLVSGRVRRKDGSYGPEFDHMALLVQLDQEEYLVDVGFGDSARVPLPMSGKVVTDVSGSYRIIAGDSADVFHFQKRTGEEWATHFLFKKTPRALEDFQEMNREQQTDPRSPFTQKRICSLATPNGRITISGESLIETVGGEKTTTPIASAEELDELLRKRFGIFKEDEEVSTQEKNGQRP